MAVVDLWHTGKPKRRTALYGKGLRWQARWRDHGVQRKKNFATKDAAELWDAERKLTPAQRATRTTVGDQWPKWIGGKVLKATTAADYRQKWRLHVEPQWGDRTIASITHSEVAGWVGDVTARTSPTTARRCFVVLSGIIRSAILDGVADADPTAAITLPRVTAAEVAPLTPAQLATMADLCRPHHLVVWTLGLTGIRFGEMAALTVADLQGRRLVVSKSITEVEAKLVTSTPKTGRSRRVPLPAWLADDLAAHVAGRDPQAPLFPTQRGGVWRSSSFKRVWEPARKAAGLRVRVHDLRHTAASIAIGQGADAKKVQAMLGHASAAMTLDLYSHLDEGALMAVADRIGNAVPRPEAP
ncbi:tyrosine-type recombinase/integrase [Propionibacteriaceae bacterium Y1700]|uniref:tyrosine-type recombinase/integrase n=1 Tax=Microlunatus sp. Y1700 TaxID=3418487 RepID=UPI003DA70A12